MRYILLASVLSLMAACSDDQSTCETGTACTSPDLSDLGSDALGLDASMDGNPADSGLLPDVGGDASLDSSDAADTGADVATDAHESHDAADDSATFDSGTDTGADANPPDMGADVGADAAVDGGGTPPGAYDETNWTMKTWSKNESASVGTPDSYFFDVDSGSPLTASITGGGNGTWSVNVYGGYSNSLYPCSGTPTCQVMLKPEDTTVIITAITTDIGYYQLSVRYSGSGLQ